MIPNELTLGARIAFSAVDYEYPVDPRETAAVQAGATAHLIEFFLLEFDLRATFAVSTRATIELLAPFRFPFVGDRFRLSTGERREDLGVPHERGATFAPGDVELGGRFRIFGASPGDPIVLDARLGVALPSGPTEPNPFELASRGEPHAHVFFGRGTFDPIAGIQGSGAWGSVRIFAYAWARATLYENSDGFRGGSQLSAGAGAELGSDSLRIRLTPSIYHRGADRWRGVESTEGPSKTDVALTAAIRLLESEGWPLEISYSLPVTIASSSPLSHHSPNTLAVTLEHRFLF